MAQPLSERGRGQVISLLCSGAYVELDSEWFSPPFFFFGEGVSECSEAPVNVLCSVEARLRNSGSFDIFLFSVFFLCLERE